MSQHIDAASLQELKSIMEDDFDLLVSTFINDSVKRIEALRCAIAEQDAQAVRAAAHSFKGSSLNICAPDLAELCRLLETASRNDDLGDAPLLLKKIEDEFEIVASTLRGL